MHEQCRLKVTINRVELQSLFIMWFYLLVKAKHVADTITNNELYIVHASLYKLLCTFVIMVNLRSLKYGIMICVVQSDVWCTSLNA